MDLVFKEKMWGAKDNLAAAWEEPAASSAWMSRLLSLTKVLSLAGVIAAAGATDWVGSDGEPALPLVDAEWAPLAEIGGVLHEERPPVVLAGAAAVMTMSPV